MSTTDVMFEPDGGASISLTALAEAGHAEAKNFYELGYLVRAGRALLNAVYTSYAEYGRGGMLIQVLDVMPGTAAAPEYQLSEAPGGYVAAGELRDRFKDWPWFVEALDTYDPSCEAICIFRYPHTTDVQVWGEAELPGGSIDD